SLDERISTAGEPASVGEVVSAIRDLLHTCPTQPERMSVRAAEVTVEVVWPQGNSSAPDAVAAPPPADVRPDARYVRAPSVGTFYRAPSPGAEPFVKEGEVVRPGRQVAIVEAMKLMLPVEADQTGRVSRFLKDDGEPVE